MKTLKTATLEELYDEINFRENKLQITEVNKQCAEIKSLKIKGLSTDKCIVYYFVDRDYEEPREIYQFYFIIKKKEKDFYYGEHGLDWTEWTKFIPPHFNEVCENSYEFRKNISLEGAKEILKKCGYKIIKKIQE